MRSMEIRQKASRELISFICYEMDMLGATEIKAEKGVYLPNGWTLKMSERKDDFEVNGTRSADMKFDELCITCDIVEGLYLGNPKDYYIDEETLYVDA